MRDHQDRAPLGTAEVPEHVEDLAAAARVEVAGRLVGEHQLGLEQERPGDRDALLLAAGELCRRVLGAVAEAHQLQQLMGAPADRAVGAAGDEPGQQHVLLRAQRAEQVEELEDEADVVAAQLRQRLVVGAVVAAARDGDGAGRWRLERADDVQQRALARARRPHDRDHLAGRHHEVDAVECTHLRASFAEHLHEVPDLDRSSDGSHGPIVPLIALHVVGVQPRFSCGEPRMPPGRGGRTVRP